MYTVFKFCISIDLTFWFYTIHHYDRYTTHIDSSTMTVHDDDLWTGEDSHTYSWFSFKLLLIVLIVLVCFRGRINSRLRLYRAKPSKRNYASGFAGSVSQVAHTIRADCTEALFEGPASGIYDCEMKEHEMTDKKTADIIRGGNITASTITLVFTNDSETSGGMSINGRRCISRTTGGGFYTIEEGCVASSGVAYWVERSSEQSILVSGCFRGDSFDGEWLTSEGARGRYTKFTQREKVEADGAESPETESVIFAV